MFKPIMAAAAFGAALATAPAFAGEAEVNSISVAYDDLNLESENGQKVLERRLEAAARKLCGVDEVRTGTRIIASERRTCLSVARKSAKTQFAQAISENQLGG